MSDPYFDFEPGEKQHYEQSIARREHYNEGYREGYGDGYRRAAEFHKAKHARFEELRDRQYDHLRKQNELLRERLRAEAVPDRLTTSRLSVASMDHISALIDIDQDENAPEEVIREIREWLAAFFARAQIDGPIRPGSVAATGARVPPAGRAPKAFQRTGANSDHEENK